MSQRLLALLASLMLTGIPLVGHAAQIVPNPNLVGSTIAVSDPLSVNALIPLTSEGTITITAPSTLTNNGTISTNTSVPDVTASSVGIDEFPIQIGGASITPSTGTTATGTHTLTITGTSASVPEPDSLLLLVASLAGLVAFQRKLVPRQENE